MAKNPVVSLPDLADDADFMAKLTPLVAKVVPAAQVQSSKPPVEPRNVNKTNRIHDRSESANSVAQARAMLDEIERKRGEKRAYTFKLPMRVVNQMNDLAENEGKSLTTKLLEILKGSGLDVIPEDFIDIRKLKRK